LYAFFVIPRHLKCFRHAGELPKESIQHSEHGESLKSRIVNNNSLECDLVLTTQNAL